jgi:hypothetical protein
MARTAMPRVLRPKAVVLPDDAVIGERPKRFTHQVVAEQPFHWIDTPAEAPPDGRFAPGTRLLMLAHDGGPHCTVQDAEGRCAITPLNGLRPLQ